jgi:hypothetical protein
MMASMAATCPLLMDGSDLSEISRLVVSQFSRSQKLRFPDAEYPESLRISNTCLPKRMT